MKIAEMRSALDLANLRKNRPPMPDTMPDFIIRNIYERRHQLPLTPLPLEFLNRTSKHKTAATRKAQVERALSEIASENDAELILKARATLSMLL